MTTRGSVRGQAAGPVNEIDLDQAEAEARQLIHNRDYRAGLELAERLRAHHGRNERIFRLAGAAAICGDMQQVAQQCLQQLEQLPRGHAVSILQDWAQSCAGTRQFAKAATLMRSALEAEPDNVECLVEFSSYSLMLGRANDAEAALKRALAAHPEHVRAHEQMARFAFQTGDAGQARAHAMNALAHNPGSLIALRTLGDLRTTEIDDAMLESLEAAADRDAGDDQSRVHRGFALGSLYEARGEAARAFRHYSDANAAQARLANARDLGSDERALKGAQAELGPRLKHVRPLETPSAARAIFVVGVSRSGTTLTEQILAAHDAVIAAGERSDLPDFAIRIAASPDSAEAMRTALGQFANNYLAAIADDSTVQVDKQPVNFRLLALIGKLFPDARVVRLHRDPRDVCISNFASPIRPEMSFATSIDAIADEIEDFVASCEHPVDLAGPNVLDVVYEDLVRAPEAEIGRILEFCGLPWQNDCLRFFDNRRPVHTISAVQVRQPLNPGSIGRWKPFAQQLAPWLERLDALETRARRTRAGD